MKAGFRRSIPVLAGIILSIMISMPLQGSQGKTTSPFEIVGRIGISEAADQAQKPYQFAGIVSIDCDASGNIYVLDYKDCCVKVFDSDGRFLRAMFRPGKGPEELSAPYRLHVSRASGRLFIIQEGGFQMKEFDSGGGFIKSHVPPSQVLFHASALWGEDRLVYLDESRGRHPAFRVWNFRSEKVEKEFAAHDLRPMSGAAQKFVIQADVLWTCPGDEMRLISYDLKTGGELEDIPIPVGYKASGMLKGENWQAVLLYNFAQPLSISGRIHSLITKQDFYDPREGRRTEPKNRTSVLYRLDGRKLSPLPQLPDLECFLDYHTTWQDRLIVSSNPHDAVPRIFILRVGS